MSASLTSLAYLVAAVLFILALRGLSHPETSRRGNTLGIIGMAIAILATLAHAHMSLSGIGLIILAMCIGGALRPTRPPRIELHPFPPPRGGGQPFGGGGALFAA